MLSENYKPDALRIDRAFRIIAGYIQDGEKPYNLTDFLLEFAIHAKHEDKVELEHCGYWAVEKAWINYVEC